MECLSPEEVLGVVTDLGDFSNEERKLSKGESASNLLVPLLNLLPPLGVAGDALLFGVSGSADLDLEDMVLLGNRKFPSLATNDKDGFDEEEEEMKMEMLYYAEDLEIVRLCLW